MTAFLAELGKKLAERWVALLALPGVLFLATALTAATLGHARALDWRRLVAAVPSGLAPVRLVLLAVALLVAASAVGLAARGLGALVEAVLLGRARGPLRWLVKRRQRRWDRRDDAYEQAPVEEQADRAADRNRVALTRPGRLTWVGDRVRAAGVRVHGHYGLDVTFTWACLWLVLSDAVRADVTAARAALRDAAVLGAWGVAYLAVGAWWWPVAPVALVVLVTARRRARAAADSYAALVEAAYDLHAADVAEALGLAAPDRVVTPALGRVITERLRKGA
ncbi:hypothetical protein [Saccharothrix sp. HUAS TT1]|uniref:hypothetical protein n=1 Tax=unclassified Saccharothrix TaxID=2593673 RepID=UPI00345C45C6